MFAKRVWFVTAFTISLLMVAAPATRADSKNEAHEAIQRACARIDAAFNSKDINTLFSFFTSDFVLISEKGKRTSWEEYRKNLSQNLADPIIKSIKSMTTIEKFILEGDTATVFCKGMSTMVVVDPQTGANNVVVSNSRELATWVKRNGRWLIKQAEVMSSEVTINGNPVQMPE